jgi:hypothetical protein
LERYCIHEKGKNEACLKGCLRKCFQVFEKQAKAKRRRKTAGKIEGNLQENQGGEGHRRKLRIAVGQW